MKKNFFIIISWIIVLSVAGCTTTVAQGPAADTQVTGAPPTSVPIETMPPEPTAADTPVENMAQAQQDESAITPPATVTPGAEENKTMTGQAVNEGTAKLVTIAKEDLAQRLNITPAEIEVVEVQEMTWGDTSMGCPHPEMRYKQIPQDGLLIKLRVTGKVYEYHSGGNRDPFLCEQTVKVKPTSPKLDLNLDKLVPPPGMDN
jgi:hypothetical protein